MLISEEMYYLKNKAFFSENQLDLVDELPLFTHEVSKKGERLMKGQFVGSGNRVLIDLERDQKKLSESSRDKTDSSSKRSS